MKDPSGRSGQGCRLCAGGLVRTLSANAPPGTYVFEAWGRRVADPTPTGWTLKVQMASADADKDDSLSSNGFTKLSVTLVTTSTATSEILRMTANGTLSSNDCAIVDDVAFYRK